MTNYVDPIYRIKKAPIYKQIRSIINQLFGSPEYSDNIINGVSFKWYVRPDLAERLGNTSIKEAAEEILRDRVFPEFSRVRFETKLLRHRGRDIFPSLRILVRI